MRRIFLSFIMFLNIMDIVHAQEDPNNFQHPIIYFPLSNHVIAVDGKGEVYSFDALKEKDVSWQKVIFDSKFQNYKVNTVACAVDGSGYCVFSLNNRDSVKFSTLIAGNNNLNPLDISADNILAVMNSKNVIYSTKDSSALQNIFNYNISSQTSDRIGYMQFNESPVTLLVDGIFQLYIKKEDGNVRMLNSEKIVTNISTSGLTKITRFGVLSSEYWFNANRVENDWLSYRVHSYKSQTDGTLKRYAFKHKAALESDSLSIGDSYVGTSKGDIISVKIADKYKSLSFLCYDKPSKRYGEGDFYPLSFFADAKLNASPFGDGFLVETQHPAIGAQLQYISFSDDQLDRIGGVDCKSRPIRAKKIPFKSNGLPENWEYENVQFKSSEGHALAAIVIKPKDTPIKKLVFDVYGAYGEQRNYHLLPARFYDELRENNIAIIYPLVRGDGNWGRKYAVSSHTPNRLAAIKDVVEIVNKFRDQLLDKDGKVILRGGSAGAWLAVQTAFNSPDLIDHVIANSGAYFLGDIPNIENNSFFSDLESVDLTSRPKCQSTFFTLIHYIDDPITPINQTQRLAKFLGANSCRGEIKGLNGDKHVLPDFREGETDKTIYELMKLYHGLDSSL